MLEVEPIDQHGHGQGAYRFAAIEAMPLVLTIIVV